MASPPPDTPASYLDHGRDRDRDFPTTHWTVVLNAANPRRPESRAALQSLCEAYWYPLYAYARRRGASGDDARDLTQDFFVRILEGRYLDRADPEKGKFRAFLLTSFRFFLSDEADRARAQKRGGGTTVLPFEIATAEQRYQREPRDEETPERIYQRRWALAMLDRTIGRLRSEFEQHGRLDHFDKLKAFLLSNSDVPYSVLAPELGMSESALKVSIHRLRKRYRELFRQEIEATVSGPEAVEEELRFLVVALTQR